MQNTHHSAPAAWPRLMEEAVLAMRSCEYMRETTRSHLMQVPQNKTRTATTEPIQSTGSNAPSRAGLEPEIRPLPITQDDVISLRRLGADRFEATKRSGELWIGDAVLLETLPQGCAKLATLIVTERMNAREAKAKQ